MKMKKKPSKNKIKIKIINLIGQRLMIKIIKIQKKINIKNKKKSTNIQIKKIKIQKKVVEKTLNKYRKNISIIQIQI